MWITEFEKRGVECMKGLFFLWRPIARNNYFLLEKQNSKFLFTHVAKSSTTLNDITLEKEKEQETKDLHNQINNTVKEYEKYTERHEQWVDFKIGVWKKIYKYLPESWTLAPNETYRIVSMIDPFNPSQVAVSDIQKEIEYHWVTLNQDIFDRIKKIPDPNEKQRILNVYLDSLHPQESINNISGNAGGAVVSGSGSNSSSEPNITQI